MSRDRDVEPDPYRYRLGWGPAARLNAASRIRNAIANNSGLLAVSEAVAEEMLDLFVAYAASITLLEEGGYRELVNVGYLEPGEQRFPDDPPYEVARFPLSTRLLLDGGGYLSASRSSALYQEFQAMWPGLLDGSFLGVPVFAHGELRGELYVARAAGEPAFIDEDVDAARDLATLYGAVLPDLLTGERRP
ncbi:MAG TPA: GAF domain-containing protein [Actinomycetes bacterium]|nr:GAF domain-containing protein [Actinomycetes bacterium]